MDKIIKDTPPYETIPPIMPGMKVVSDYEGCFVIQKFDESQTFLGWYLSRYNSQQISNGSNPENDIFLAGPDEYFYTSLLAYTDSVSGKDKAYVIGKNKIYLIGTDDNNSLEIFNKPLPPGTATPDMGIFFSHVASVPRVQKKSDQNIGDEILEPDRVFYAYKKSVDGDVPTLLYDLNDNEWGITLPFRDSFIVLSGVRITNQFVTYLVFICYDRLSARGRSEYDVVCFAIPETKLLDHETAAHLTLDDFIFYITNSTLDEMYLEKVHNLGPSVKYLTIPVISGNFNSNQQGELQFVFYSQGNAYNFLEVIQLTDGGTALQTVARFSWTPIGGMIKPQKDFLKYWLNGDGTYTFIIPHYNIDRDIQLYLINYSGVNNTFSIEQVYRLALDSSAGTFDRLLITFLSVFPITSEDLSTIEGVYIIFRAFPVKDMQFVQGYPVKFWGHYCKLVQNANKHYVFSTSDEGQYLENLQVWQSSNLKSNITYENYLKLNPDQLGGYLSASVDFSGRSIVLGSPGFTQQTEVNQIFSLYKVIPFPNQFVSALPSLSFSNSETVMSGVSTSTHSTWSAGISTDSTFTAGIVTVHGHFSQTWGGSELHMKGEQKTINLHVTSSFSKEDGIHAYITNFYVWQYPLYKKSEQVTAFGYLTVVIPSGGLKDAVLTTSDKDFAYDQDYEVGNLLSYVGAQKPGYDQNNLWFNSETLVVPSDTSGSTLSYNRNNNTQQEDSKTTDLSTNASLSVTLNIPLPEIGGSSNDTVSGFFNKSEMDNKTQSLNTTKDLSITFNSGTVTDSDYEYLITPYVYNHKENNMLIVDYDISLVGAGWKSKFQAPAVMMMRPFPFSNSFRDNKYTRSIRFSVNEDGTVDIMVKLFNSSFSEATKITCELYAGDPMFEQKEIEVKNTTKLGVVSSPSLEAFGRGTLTLPNQKIKLNTIITAILYSDDLREVAAKYYWGIFPYSAFGNLSKK